MKDRDFSETFPNNFLTSVSFEVRFHPLLLVQQSIPEFQKIIRTDYPTMKKGLAMHLIPQIGSMSQEVVEWAFSSEDGSSQLKVAIDKLAIVRTGYNGYDRFIDEIGNAVGSLAKIAGINEYTRVGLRYINEIPLANEDNIHDTIIRFFNPHIEKKRVLDSKPFKFDTELRVRVEDIAITSKNRFTKEQDSKQSYVIDIDSYTHRRIAEKELESTVGTLHEHIRREFHNSITDEFVDILRGEKEWQP